MEWRSIIVDDQSSDRIGLRSALERYCPNVEITAEADSVSSAYKAIVAHSPDVVFLDIRLRESSGFELLERFSKPYPFRVIFVSAYNGFALEAFRFAATDYLLKPIQAQELQEAVRKLGDYIKVNKIVAEPSTVQEPGPAPRLNRLSIGTTNGFIMVNYDNITHLTSDSNYTEVYLTTNERIVSSKTLKEYERILPKNIFFRTHQSYMVHINHVHRYTKESGGIIILTDGSEICLARRRREQFLRWLKGEY